AAVLSQTAPWAGPSPWGEGRSAGRLGLHLAVQPHGPAGAIDPVRLDERRAAAGAATGGPARGRRPGAARGGCHRGPGPVVRPAAGGITQGRRPVYLGGPSRTAPRAPPSHFSGPPHPLRLIRPRRASDI